MASDASRLCGADHHARLAPQSLVGRADARLRACLPAQQCACVRYTHDAHSATTCAGTGLLRLA